MGVVHISVETTHDEFEIRVECAAADYCPADRSVGIPYGWIDGVWEIRGDVYVYDEEGDEFLLEPWEVALAEEEILEACNREDATYGEGE